MAEARRYIGTNPTGRSSLWCGHFMNLVLERTGRRGSGSNMARSFASYGTRVSGPQVGAIAVMSRGKRGGHVGVVSGIDANGNPIIISGNHGRRVAEVGLSARPHLRLRDAVTPEILRGRSAAGQPAADRVWNDPCRRRVRKACADKPSSKPTFPARLDRLPWGRFHTLVVAALGITWILDGLEVTLAGAVAGALKASPVLQFSNADVGFAASAYLAGAVLGALFFGWLTDRLGRKKLFFITLAVYLVATAATAFSWNFWSFALFRFLTGAGIGGEYAAINSTIQELIPARVRGWTDLVINGSFWIGAALGALGAIVLLDPAVIDPEYGWRLAFLIGALLALVIFFMRLWLPESPRWLMTHGRAAEAERVVADDRAPACMARRRSPAGDLPRVRLRARSHTPLTEVARTLLHRLSPAHAGRPEPDGRAGVLLQRDLLHLCAGADRLLRHPGEPRRLVHPAVRRGQFPRPAAARPAVRHHRPPADDRLHLHHVGRAAGGQRLSVRAGRAHGDAADAGLDRSSSSSPRRRRARPISR